MAENVILDSPNKYVSIFKKHRISITKHYNDDLYNVKVTNNLSEDVIYKKHDIGCLNITECALFLKDIVNKKINENE